MDDRSRWFKGIRLVVFSLSALVLVFGAGLPIFISVQAADVTNGLDVKIIAAPNLVVDSNVMSPSTFQPIVATIIGEFCNTDSSATLTNVVGYIGDYGGDGFGDYPDHTPGTISGGGVSTTYEGTYQFQHLGGMADAVRAIGTLAPGECSYQYWSFTYPKYATEQGGPTDGIPAWGTSVKPGDDLWLEFDIWGTGSGAPTSDDNETHRMTMRNEISAMANKIEPNGNPGGRWFNTDTSTVFPGDTVTTNGILYRLGNVNQGFDNDGDGVPDYNAWLQPFGDPAYDPSCFRLISTTGTVTVTTNTGDVIIPFQDKLYFSNLPTNNTNVVGVVYYEFMALGGACTIPITPYQEVASGSDNEKFNGDYGAGPEPMGSYEPAVSITKIAPGTTGIGTAYTYNIPFANTSTTATAGLTISSGGSVDMPLVVEDSIPEGLEYVCGSAGTTLTGSNTVTIYYSTDSGASWSTSEPTGCPGTNPTSTGPNDLIMLRWILENPLPVSPEDGSTGNTATFQALVPSSGYTGSSFIENCAEGKFGISSPAFTEGCAVTVVEGTGSIGDLVWADVNGDGSQTGESGIRGIKVDLFWDKNNNGVLEPDVDVFISTQDSLGTGTQNYDFTLLPAGQYIVIVDANDTDLPAGYSLTTVGSYVVNLAGGQDFDAADFGFGPTLRIDKHLDTLDPAVVGETVTFHIDLVNTRPGDGTENGYCVYDVWAGSTSTDSNANQEFTTIANAVGTPNLMYSTADFGTGGNRWIAGSDFSSGGRTSGITKVEAIFEIFVTQNLDDDGAEVSLANGATSLGTQSFVTNDMNVYAPGENKKGKLVWDVSSIGPGGTWEWSDFTSSLSLQYDMDKTGASDTGNLNLDALGLRVTTDDTSCADSDSTIAVLPLDDTYDTSYLQFVSSDPPVTTSSPGALHWDNLGPLYSGGTVTVDINYIALATTASTTNSAAVTNAEFSSGRDVNDDNDTATVGINTSYALSGKTWIDAGGTIGWVTNQGNDPIPTTDRALPGIQVDLYVCNDPLTGLPIPQDNNNNDCVGLGYSWDFVATTYTDPNGDYSFAGLRSGYYNVQVNNLALATGMTNRTAEASGGASGTGTTCGTCDGAWNEQSADIRDLTYLGTVDIDRISFGFNNPTVGTVTGFVWHDDNRDNVWDSTEAPIPGTTVTLTCTGNAGCPAPVVTTTNDQGYYQFSSLPILSGASWQVVVTPPAGMAQSGDPEGGACYGLGACDNQTNLFTLTASGAHGPDGFGYDGGLTIGDTIYTDWDGDGVQGDSNPANGNEGEAGIQDILVYLYRDVNADGVFDAATDVLVGTQTTDSNGEYNFTDVPGNGSDYLVIVAGSTIPSGYKITGDPEGGCPGGATCDGEDVITDLGASNYLLADFGYQPQGFGTIGDYVWIDGDGDGEQDADESGSSSISMNLYHDQDGDGIIDAEDALVDTTTTLGYAVIDGYIDTSGNGSIGAEDALADLYGYEVIAGALDINGDGSITSADGGSFGPYLVFAGRLDMNGDGSGDTNDDGSLAGFYLFNDLPAADFIVQVDSATFGAGGDLEGYSMTTTGTGYNMAQTSHMVELTGAALTYYDADFGFATTKLGDTVWQDNNGDGIHDASEPGINDVTMQLYIDSNNDGQWDGGDEFVNSVETANIDGQDGKYFFTGMPAENYIIRVDPTETGIGGTLETFLLSGDPDVYNDLNPDSVSCLTAGAMGCDGEKPYDRFDSSSQYDENPAVLPGTVELTADFGYQPSAYLGDTVWVDSDGDGVVDDGESGIPFITVELCSDAACSSVVATTETDENGIYSFGNIGNGSYYVQVDTSDPQWPANISTINISAADPDGSADNTTNVTVSSNTTTAVGSCSDAGGTCALDADFGYQLNGSQTLSGTVFFDAGNDGNNYGESGDSPYEGITVYLRDGNNVLIGTATTDVNGYYQFTNLPSDTYTVAIDTDSPQLAALIATREPDADPCGSCNGNAQVVLGGTGSSGNDFGFFGSLDFGDLPDTYNSNPTIYTTEFASGGPHHQIGALYLGSYIDAEVDGDPTGTANSDDLNQIENDEDGVTRDMLYHWLPSATVQLNVDVTGTGGYLVGWFDFNGDGDFSDAGEIRRFGSVNHGASQLSLTLPSSYVTGSTVNTRFRLYDGAPSIIAPTGGAINGEVEDYQWPFTPNAVNLADFSAGSQIMELNSLVVLLGVVLLLGMGSIFLIRRRRNYVTIRR